MEQYHDAPHTLDSQRDIEDEAPPSAGHDQEMSERVRERDQSFTEGVEEERERVAEHGEVGPQDPRAPDDDSEESQERREQTEEQQAQEPQPRQRRKRES